MDTIQLGSVSSGTLRVEDLVPVCMDVLGEFAPKHPLLTESLDDLFTSDMDTPYDLLSDLEDAIQEYCPPLVFFGAHPDMPDAIGFWPDWDTMDDLGIDGAGEYTFDDVRVVMDSDETIHIYDLATGTLLAES